MDERGSIAPLLVGFVLLLLVGVAVVVDSSAVFIGRQGLESVAEGAALRGADAGAQAVHRGGVPEGRLPQIRREVVGAVRQHLISSGAGDRYPGIRASVTVDEVARTVQVEITAQVELPLAVPGVAGRVTVTARSRAAVQVRR